MQPMTRVYLLDEQGTRFFGEGPYRLLRALEELGSLRAAAASMEMAYTKALRILRRAEEALGVPLTVRSTGGKNGGGSTLTPEGRAILEQYERYRAACTRANREIFERIFAPEPHFGCVIMASGLSRRFGSNKLLAEFGSEPLILRALAATEGVFARRVVVTRSPEVAALCEAHGVQTVLHELPHRSDTVRLGLDALGEGLSGCLFCPADQPLLRRESVKALAEAAAREPGFIWRLSWRGEPGAPVLFPSWCFPELNCLPEGKGGDVVIRRWPEKVRTVEAAGAEELRDADTPEELEALMEDMIDNNRSGESGNHP